jgi:hypothetical protein
MSLHIFRHQILQELRKQVKITDAEIDNGKIHFRYFKSFLSGGLGISLPIIEGKDPEESVVTRCYVELVKERRDLESDITTLASQLKTRRMAKKKAIDRINQLFPVGGKDGTHSDMR